MCVILGSYCLIGALIWPDELIWAVPVQHDLEADLGCCVMWYDETNTTPPPAEGDSVWNWNQFAPCIGGPCSYLLVKPGPERGNYMIQYTVVTALLSYWSLSLSLSSPWYLVYLRVGACHGLYRHSTLIKSEYNSDWIGIFCDIFPLSRPNDPANNDGNTSFLDWTQFFVPHR